MTDRFVSSSDRKTSDVPKDRFVSAMMEGWVKPGVLTRAAESLRSIVCSRYEQPGEGNDPVFSSQQVAVFLFLAIIALRFREVMRGGRWGFPPPLPPREKQSSFRGVWVGVSCFGSGWVGELLWLSKKVLQVNASPSVVVRDPVTRICPNLVRRRRRPRRSRSW